MGGLTADPLSSLVLTTLPGVGHPIRPSVGACPIVGLRAPTIVQGPRVDSPLPGPDAFRRRRASAEAASAPGFAPQSRSVMTSTDRHKARPCSITGSTSPLRGLSRRWMHAQAIGQRCLRWEAQKRRRQWLKKRGHPSAIAERSAMGERHCEKGRATSARIVGRRASSERPFWWIARRGSSGWSSSDSSGISTSSSGMHDGFEVTTMPLHATASRAGEHSRIDVELRAENVPSAAVIARHGSCAPSPRRSGTIPNRIGETRRLNTSDRLRELPSSGN